MWTLFLIGLGSGLSWTPHCLGMCGGFPLHLAKSSGSGSILLRQSFFLAGKGFTYIFLGALAGASGAVLFKNTSFAPYAPVLRLAAGVLTVVFGLLMLGLRMPKLKALQGVSDMGLFRSLFGGLLKSPSPFASLCLGVGVGFLPCPLPMAMLLQAAAHSHVVSGIALMAGMGLGTVPGLLAVGFFGFGIDKRFSRVGMRTAGALVLVLGLLTIGRVTGVIHASNPINHAVPPCCKGH